MSYGGDSATPDQCGRESADDITFLEAEDSYIGDTILLYCKLFRNISKSTNEPEPHNFLFGKIRTFGDVAPAPFSSLESPSLIFVGPLISNPLIFC
jgi:hypothetical protein